MINRKDLTEDAAKGIDKAASLHLFEIQATRAVATVTAESNTHERDLDLRCFVQGRKADACPACGQESETQDHMWRCQETLCVAIRECGSRRRRMRKTGDKNHYSHKLRCSSRKTRRSSLGTKHTGKKMKFASKPQRKL